MKRIREKLNSSRGATILFALLIFMLCVVAGTAALTAAASNAGRFSHAGSDQQQYLSVSSAAGLLRDEFGGTTFKAEISLEETYTWAYKPVYDDPDDEENREIIGYELDPAATSTSYALGTPVYSWTGDAELVQAVFESQLENLFRRDEVLADWYEKTEQHAPGEISYGAQTLRIVGDGELEDSLGEVKATLSLDKGTYDIHVELGLAPSDGNGGGDLLYASSMFLPGKTSSRVSSKPPVITGDEDEMHGTRVITQTLTFTVTWQAGSIDVGTRTGGAA